MFYTKYYKGYKLKTVIENQAIIPKIHIGFESKLWSTYDVLWVFILVTETSGLERHYIDTNCGQWKQF